MKIIIAGLASLALVGCNFGTDTARDKQAQKAAAAAESIRFSENAEIENIKKRLTLTADPGLIGYVVLLNEMGQPIVYTTVKGKITSGSKRLTSPEEWSTNSSTYRQAPSDEGTYGSSNPYIYFWSTSGQYYQWSGQYLYSDKPFRLAQKPLVVDIDG